MLRYASEREKTNQILNLTSLTVEQFEQLVEPFEQAFVRPYCMTHICSARTFRSAKQ
jgi:hypothetical protein